MSQLFGLNKITWTPDMRLSLHIHIKPMLSLAIFKFSKSLLMCALPLSFQKGDAVLRSSFYSWRLISSMEICKISEPSATFRSMPFPYFVTWIQEGELIFNIFQKPMGDGHVQEIRFSGISMVLRPEPLKLLWSNSHVWFSAFRLKIAFQNSPNAVRIELMSVPQFPAGLYER